MKIAIRITVDVDPDAWATEYGVPRYEVRDDVLIWARTHIVDELDARGMLATDGYGVVIRR
jgi:hypothetical protein